MELLVASYPIHKYTQAVEKIRKAGHTDIIPANTFQFSQLFLLFHAYSFRLKFN